MKSMRPFQIIILAVFGILAVLGLVLFASYQGFGGKKPLGPITIWGTLPDTAVNAALDDLKRSHQEYAKAVYVERPADTFDADVADALASGTGPDLILTDQEHLLAEEPKLTLIPFSTIPERTYRDAYVPATEIYLTGSGTYGIPFVVDPLVLYYNRATLAGAGVAEAPATWEAVLGLAPKLVQKTPGGGIGKSVIALGTYDNIPDARAIVSLLLLQSGTTISADTAQGLRSTLLSAQATATYGALPSESAISFYTQFADPAKVVYSWNRAIPDARNAFISGDTALYVGYASERALLSASNPNLDFDLAKIPEPQTAGRPADYARAYAFSIPKASHNAQGAYQLATALASAPESLIAARALGIAPARRDSLTPSASDLSSPVVYPLALISESWLSPAPAITDRIFAGMITSILSGAASVHDALVSADQALNAAL